MCYIRGDISAIVTGYISEDTKKACFLSANATIHLHDADATFLSNGIVFLSALARYFLLKNENINPRMYVCMSKNLIRVKLLIQETFYL